MGQRKLYALDSAVCSVCSAVGVRGLVDVDQADVEVLRVELVRCSVGFCVFDKGNKELGALDWPATCHSDDALVELRSLSWREGLTLGGLPSLGLSSSADTAVVTSERNALLVLLHVRQVLESFRDLHAGDSSSGFSVILVEPSLFAIDQ